MLAFDCWLVYANRLVPNWHQRGAPLLRARVDVDQCVGYQHFPVRLVEMQSSNWGPDPLAKVGCCLLSRRSCSYESRYALGRCADLHWRSRLSSLKDVAFGQLDAEYSSWNHPLHLQMAWSGLSDCGRFESYTASREDHEQVEEAARTGR